MTDPDIAAIREQIALAKAMEAYVQLSPEQAESLLAALDAATESGAWPEAEGEAHA